MKNHNYKGEHVKEMPFEQEDNTWYEPEKVEILLKKYTDDNSIRIKEAVYSKEQLEARINEIGSDEDQLKKFIIPLNVNVSKGNFEKQNHWVGIYIIKEQNSIYKIKYYNPTGDKINDDIEQQLYHLLTSQTESVRTVLQYGTSLQHNSEIFEFQGNTNDCGPFLVYGLTCISQGKEIFGVSGLVESKQLGQKLRKELINQDSFDRLYVNINVDNISNITLLSKLSKSSALISQSTSQMETDSTSVTKSSSAIFTDTDDADVQMKAAVERLKKEEHTLVKEIKTLLSIRKILYNTETNYEQENQSVLVIGKTGVGKSTLVNYLTNPEKMEVKWFKEEKQKYGKGRLKIEIKDCPGAPAISVNSVNSTTTIPNKWNMYWDCPGFDDNKSVEQDIKNALFIQRVFNVSKNVKLVLVISWGDLDNNVNELKRLTDTLGNLFNNVEDIIPGLTLVVTKVPYKKDIDDIQGNIARLLGATCFNESSSGKKILESILESKERIALFPEITDEGSIVNLIGENEKVLKVINSAEFVISPEVNIAISDRSQNRVGEIVTVLNEGIDGFIASLTQRYINNNKVVIKNSSSKEALVEGRSLIVKDIDRIDKFLERIDDKLQNKVGEYSKVKEIAKVLKEHFLEYESIGENISEYIELFKFCIDLKKETEEFLKTSGFLQYFSNSQKELKRILDTADGQLVRIIVDEADNTLQEFIKSIKEDLTTNLPIAIDSNDKDVIEFYKNYTDVVQKSFSNVITLDTIPIIVESLASYSHKINLNTITQHRELLDKLPAEWGRNYNQSLSEFIKPLKEFQEEYNFIVNDIQRRIHNKFEEYFSTFYRQISLNNDTLDTLKSLSKKIGTCLEELQGVQSIGSFIEIVLKFWPFDNNLIEAKSVLNKIKDLQQIHVNVSSIDPNELTSYIKQLERSKLNVDSIYTNLYESAIIYHINSIIEKIKGNYSKLGEEQQNHLVAVLNTKLEGDFFVSISSLGEAIISKYSVLILIKEDLIKINSLEALSMLQKDKLENLNQVFIKALHNKLEDLSTYISSMAGDKAVQDFVESMINYINHIDIHHDKITDIISDLESLENLFKKAKEDSATCFIQKMIQNNLDHSDIYNKALDYLKEIDLTANLNFTNYTQSLDKLCTTISDQITWYSIVEKVFEIILTRGYLFANDYPTVDNVNFPQFFSLLKHNGLTLTTDIEYNDHKAKQLNDLLKHSWQKPVTKYIHNQELVFKGECVKISDLMKDIGRTVTSVKVVCYNSIVFDADIIAKGVNLSAISPLWYIPAPVTLDLSGRDALPHSLKAKDGSGYVIGTGIGNNGVDGRLGKSGENAGDFLGIGYKFVNQAYILANVNLTGGKGGQGQSGGNGGHGQYGADATIQDFWDNYGTIIPNEGNRYQFGKMYNRIELVKGHNGYQGGDGGKAGLGGLGGQNGTIKIVDLHQLKQLEISMLTKAANGEPGTAGQGGKGGKYGNDLKVYYFQNQYTTLRDHKVINIDKYAVDGYTPNLSTKFPIATAKNKCNLNISQELDSLKTSFVPETQTEDDFYYKIHSQIVEEFCNPRFSIELVGETI